MARNASTKSKKTFRRGEADRSSTPPLTAASSNLVNQNGTNNAASPASECDPSDPACPNKENINTKYASTNIVQDDLSVPCTPKSPKNATTPARDRPSRPPFYTRGSPGKLHKDCSMQELLRNFKAGDGFKDRRPDSGCCGCDATLAGWAQILRTGPKNDVEGFLVNVLEGVLEDPELPDENKVRAHAEAEPQTPRRPARPNTTTASPFGSMGNLYRSILGGLPGSPLDPRSPRSTRSTRPTDSPRTPRHGRETKKEEAAQSSVVVEPPTYHTRVLKRQLDSEHEVQPSEFQAEIRRRKDWTPSRKEGWRQEKWWRPNNGL